MPLPQGIGSVIPGFDYGLAGMRIGGKRRIFIPWQMAYGTRNIPDSPTTPAFPPSHITLTQDVEDFMGSRMGRAVVANASMQFLLKQSSSAVDVLAQVLK